MENTKRTWLIRLGIVLIILAVLSFLSNLLFELVRIEAEQSYDQLAIQLSLSLFAIAGALFALLRFILFAITGGMLVSEQAQLQRAGVAGTWCKLCGWADLLIALSLLLFLADTFLAFFASSLFSNMNLGVEERAELLNNINRAFMVLRWMLGLVAGVLYGVAGSSQKKLGKSNHPLFLAGILFVLINMSNIIIWIISSLLAASAYLALPPLVNIVTYLLILAAYCCRAIAPRWFPRREDAMVIQQQNNEQSQISSPVIPPQG